MPDNSRPSATGRDDGLTLVELIVYGLLLVVVLGIVGSIMVSTISIERDVRASSESTTAAQLASQSIVHGVRNGTARELRYVGDDDQLLRIRTAGSSPGAVQWYCAAWYYSSTNGTIRSTTSSDDSIGIPVPTGEPTTWTLLAEGIEASDASGDIFTATLDGVIIKFTAETAQGTTVPIVSAATLRTGGTESASCFS